MANINLRIDDELKEDSREILESLGLDLSTGIKVFLKQVVAKNGIPFELTLSELDMSVLQMEQGKTHSFENVADLMADLDND
ncbi:type II toxin-antitoxin system RelB/DinJ family antitoxin [Enterococcus asini]|uniref:type II toxin-antitoxin system RelB/DinJ family antitoxin n=1 Tax=Enterococcus asini TaxID=57732 RepID=UPI0032C11001